MRPTFSDTVTGTVTVAALIVSVLGLVGCGTSQVITDEPTARIWVNGQMIGRGHGEIQKRGTWETTSILVRTEDGREQVTTVKRSVTSFTVLGALLSDGLCLIFCWEYPDMIWASMPGRAPAYDAFANRDGGSDPWMTPPPGWQPRSTAAATATPSDASEAQYPPLPPAAPSARAHTRAPVLPAPPPTVVGVPASSNAAPVPPRW